MEFEIRKETAFVILGQAITALEEGKVYTVEIMEKRGKRSREANSYAWVLLDKLAAKMHIPKEDIYREIIKKYRW